MKFNSDANKRKTACRLAKLAQPYNPSAIPIKTSRIKPLFSRKHSHPPGPNLHIPRSHTFKLVR